MRDHKQFRLSVAGTLVAMRRRSGLSSHALAESTHVNLQDLERAELAEIVSSLSTLKKVAVACGLTLTAAARVIDAVQGQHPRRRGEAVCMAVSELARARYRVKKETASDD